MGLREQIGATTAQDQRATDKRSAPAELTPEQERQVAELREIDRRVREHEAAHIRAGRGVVTSGANFTYTYGPDGKRYAVAGEVGIDTSPESKPQDNIDKGIRIQEAALAPKDPSSQDYKVAGVGGRLEAKGRSDLIEEQQRERTERLQEQQDKEAPAAGQEGATSETGEADVIQAGADTGETADARGKLAQAYGQNDTGGQGQSISLYA